jgi:hypothetical protein
MSTYVDILTEGGIPIITTGNKFIQTPDLTKKINEKT